MRERKPSLLRKWLKSSLLNDFETSRDSWRRAGNIGTKTALLITLEGGSLMLILLILLIILLIGATPAWPYSRSWGYYPSGALGTVLLIFLVLLLLGQVNL
jgi:Protein of unknown function (DUF3309)